MTDRRPPACHWDRALGTRVLTSHREDCPRELGTGACPAAGRGCAPCTASHCLVCSREHATNDQPDTCAECLGKVRDDLVELGQDYTALAVEAIAAGADGRLVAAAPIPGGTAAVLHGPTVRLDMLRVSRTTLDDHRRGDPIPPLAVLAQWEDLYRAWFGHTRGARATVAGGVGYLTEQLDHMANGAAVREGPDWLRFTRSVRTLRAQLEHALHNEQEPERGVECFECGDQLVRRFRDPKRCRHKTPARVELQRALVRQRDGQQWMRSVLATYPELPVTEWDLAAARGPSAGLVADARRPCAACLVKHGQGGLDDPRAGRSWECPGCRKTYDVGEYVTAVRRDLLAGEGIGWCTITAAAQAATDVVGMVVPDSLVRGWLDAGRVSGLCMWRPGVPWGVRMVYWPDVAEAAIDAVERMAERARRAEQNAAWRKAVDKGEDPVVVAKRLGISRHRLRHLLDTVAA